MFVWHSYKLGMFNVISQKSFTKSNVHHIKKEKKKETKQNKVRRRRRRKRVSKWKSDHIACKRVLFFSLTFSISLVNFQSSSTHTTNTVEPFTRFLIASTNFPQRKLIRFVAIFDYSLGEKESSQHWPANRWKCHKMNSFRHSKRIANIHGDFWFCDGLNSRADVFLLDKNRRAQFSWSKPLSPITVTILSPVHTSRTVRCLFFFSSSFVLSVSIHLVQLENIIIAKHVLQYQLLEALSNRKLIKIAELSHWLCTDRPGKLLLHLQCMRRYKFNRCDILFNDDYLHLHLHLNVWRFQWAAWNCD